MPQQKFAESQCSAITPRGEGGIGVILLEGRDSAAVLASCFRGTRKQAGQIPPGKLAHGTIMHNGDVIDEVVVAHLSKNNKEDQSESCFEINCHGGALAVKTILECLQHHGAKETTWQEVLEKRTEPRLPALARGAICSEAMKALPWAGTRPAVRMLLHQAQGALCAELKRILLDLKEKNCQSARESLRHLADASRGGMAMLDPPAVMLLGAQNAGKSTLLNALLQRERVIAHPTPGTTRDVVRDRLSIGGIPFDIMDSAGISRCGNQVDKIAIEHTVQLLEQCDIILLVFDVRYGIDRAVQEIIERCRRNRRVLHVANKCDLLDEGTEFQGERHPEQMQIAYISAKEGYGLHELEDYLIRPYSAAVDRGETARAVPFTPAQRAVLERAFHCLEHGGCGHAARVLAEGGVK